MKKASNDSLLDRAARFAMKVLNISPRAPHMVDIEISTACNLACRMCKRQTIDFGDMLMPYDLFRRVLDRIPRTVELVTLGGYGEMLLHPRFCAMVTSARTRGHSTEVTTNGTLLTQEKIQEIFEAGLGMLRVSIDHVKPQGEDDVGHVFSEQIQENLNMLSALKRERKSPIRLGINTVVQSGNVDSIEDIIRRAEALGFDLVELIRLDTCQNDAERTLQYEREAELYRVLERMDRRIEVITPANRFAGRRTLYGHGGEFCIFRHAGAHIRMNGAVTPCPFGFAAHDFGSILERDLVDIWNSGEFRKVRANPRNPVCRSCSLFKWGCSAASRNEAEVADQT